MTAQAAAAADDNLSPTGRSQTKQATSHGAWRQGSAHAWGPVGIPSPAVIIREVELVRVALPLVRPFRTSFGTQTARDALLVHITTSDGVTGWGECVAMAEPVYSSETAGGAQQVMRDFLVPRLLAAGQLGAPDGAGAAAQVGPILRCFHGHPMAKAAIEMAVLDAELRTVGRSLAAHLGATVTHVDCGVSVGISPTLPQLLEEVGIYLEAGYKRIKLKIEPGWDVEPVAAVRNLIGDLPLQVDANCAYTLADARHLAMLDPYDLLLIEQPLPEDDVLGHAELATRIATPVCLDESITSARTAAAAISLGACAIANIKAGRVGGYLEAVRVHDVCQAHGVPVWCGGMLETGLGRAANVALAALPGFTLPGDTSGSDRFYTEDLTEPFVLTDGQLAVPTGPGLGVVPLPDALARFTTSAEVVAGR